MLYHLFYELLSSQISAFNVFRYLTFAGSRTARSARRSAKTLRIDTRPSAARRPWAGR